MRFIRLEFVCITILTVSTVKSECDTYLECLGLFFDSFFGNYKNLKTEKEVGNITVPGYNTVNFDSEDLNDLLSGVSEFIQEELDGNIKFSPQMNIFKNSGNSTAIYIKSLTINNHFGDHKNTSIISVPTETKDQSIIHSKSSYNLNVTNSAPVANSNVTSSQQEKSNEKDELNEILEDVDSLYYDMDGDGNDTDYLKIDYLEMYKDTTNEYTDLKPTESTISIHKVNDYDKDNKNARPDAIMFENIKNNSSISVDVTSKCSNYTKNATEAIFPWIAAIFIKNDTSDQFDYYCDGALLSETMVITSARCMEYYGSEMDAKNLLVLLGKSSLQSMSGAERAVKVNSVIIHENFTTTEGNDIAILFLERVALNEHIQTVCLGGEKGLEAATTGWAISGELTIIPFVTDQSFKCKVSKGNYTFCAAYGNDVTICPSYGGVYAVKDLNGWYLQGIRSGDPSNRGLCFDRSVYFTDLTNYVEWIDKNSK
ncbi:coagulation factor XII-like isoform X1 [Pararge aegeria]|uniref:coagulation factor XII-like isoform X1 n=1 Tax=Pararge aegeria TaxID=116150 RepID=UPI0019D27198|nr:coagulation factor XII-like isoform X1 [Pararge aegeria]